MKKKINYTDKWYSIAINIAIMLFLGSIFGLINWAWYWIISPIIFVWIMKCVVAIVTTLVDSIKHWRVSRGE